MTLDHDFVYSFPLFSYLVKKEGRRKEAIIIGQSLFWYIDGGFDNGILCDSVYL